MRTSLTGTVILVLVVSLSVAVAAQDEPDPMAPAYFTFTLEPTGEPQGPGGEGGSFEETEAVIASDSRASGVLTTSGNLNYVELEGGGLGTASAGVRLVNDGGAWSGALRGVHVVSQDGGFATGMSVLTGEEGYEGLTLIMNQYYDDDAQTLQGVIVPSDQVPPMPEQVGLAVAEEAVALIPTRDVVVATQGIEQGTVIGPEVVSMRNVPIDATNEYAFADPDKVIGRVAAIDILESQMLAPNLLEPSAS